jgi:lactoylglutathione lyase
VTATSVAHVNHVGHCVADLARARTFYEQVLGFRHWYSVSPPDRLSAPLLGLSAPLGLHCDYLICEGVVLELLAYDSSHTPATARVLDQPGLTHLSFSVADVKATCELVRLHGGEVVESTDVGVAVFVRDPDGQLLELLPSSFRSHLPPLPEG